MDFKFFFFFVCRDAWKIARDNPWHPALLESELKHWFGVKVIFFCILILSCYIINYYSHIKPTIYFKFKTFFEQESLSGLGLYAGVGASFQTEFLNTASFVLRTPPTFSSSGYSTQAAYKCPVIYYRKKNNHEKWTRSQMHIMHVVMYRTKAGCADHILPTCRRPFFFFFFFNAKVQVKTLRTHVNRILVVSINNCMFRQWFLFNYLFIYSFINRI